MLGVIWGSFIFSLAFLAFHATMHKCVLCREWATTNPSLTFHPTLAILFDDVSSL